MIGDKKIEDKEKLKEVMGLIFNLYTECDHANWEKPLFSDEKLGQLIQIKLRWLEMDLWDALMDLENTFKLDVKEVEMDLKTLKVEKKRDEISEGEKRYLRMTMNEDIIKQEIGNERDKRK